MEEKSLEIVNDVLCRVMVQGSNEHKLLEVMSNLPEKYDFGDMDVQLGITIFVGWEENGVEKDGTIEISRRRGHSVSEPFEFEFLSGQETGQEKHRISYVKGRWVFNDDPEAGWIDI